MMLRNNNAIKLRAHMILDDVKAGLYHGDAVIAWALRQLGDLSG